MNLPSNLFLLISNSRTENRRELKFCTHVPVLYHKCNCQWRAGDAKNFYLRPKRKGVWRTEVPTQVQGQSPHKDPQAEAVCRRRLQILAAETIEI